MAAKRGPKNALSEQHKAAMAEGRVEGRVVRDYLEALRNSKGKPGRRRTPDSIAKRLVAINEELSTASPVIDPSSLEAGFVSVAAAYSTRKGISYAAWRAVGVEPTVLKKAGISRGA
jgi:hypothetical protein